MVPLSGAPATELQTTHTSFDSPVYYPSIAALGKPNYWGLLTGGNQTSLLVTPAQHKAIQPGQDAVNLRRYTGLDRAGSTTSTATRRGSSHCRR